MKEDGVDERGSRAWILLPLALLLLAGVGLLIWRGGRQPAGGAGENGILYLAWDEAALPQLFVTRDQGKTSRQLTDAAEGVKEYRPSPDGRRIAYSAGREDGGADVWLVNADGTEERLLLACEGALCGGPVWRPDGQLLLYERRDGGDEGAEPGPPRLFWLDPATGESVPLFEEAEAWGQLARFSADGQWLAYVMPQWQQVRVVNVETNQIVSLPNELGESVAWHPRVPLFLFTELAFDQGEAFVTHIYRAELPEGVAAEGGALPEENVTSLSGEGTFSDNAPSWSPAGDRVAFGRKLPRTPTGRQIWVMDADGGEQRRLTESVTLQFSSPRWSPDGSRLLVQRFDIEAANEPPGIWLVDVAGGALEEVITPGFQAMWLPAGGEE